MKRIESFLKVSPSVLLSIILVLCAAGSLQAQDRPAEFTKAKIYYLGWDLSTRARLSPEDARARAMVEIAVNDPYVVGNIVKFLDLPAMKKAEQPGDPRLVIDLYKADGSMTSYYASRFTLYTEDSSLSREIDQRFRDIFDVFRKTQLAAVPEINYSWELKAWDWSLHKLEQGQYDRRLVDLCVEDYKKGTIMDGWDVKLKDVQTSLDGS
ncbi:MAG TPA: hypothetical protein VLJ10_05940, partial [Candidatus Bathyarchaeia archaeon]|nr:hypothetical protein [Candidatus Bathyarchaeia archaeon]